MKGLASHPQTLIHNDLDDRNIGLRWPDGAVAGSAALEQPDLVLIDWEWMALGPAAIDVANIIQRLPVMIAPGRPIPPAFWTNELADYYFLYYRAAGGKCADAARWPAGERACTKTKSATSNPRTSPATNGSRPRAQPRADRSEVRGRPACL